MDVKVNVKMIEDYIADNRLTKKEFCKQCNISTYTFYAIMQGKDFKLVALVKIAKKINKKLSQFF